jgi:hypothetical protein
MQPALHAHVPEPAYLPYLEIEAFLYGLTDAVPEGLPPAEG